MKTALDLSERFLVKPGRKLKLSGIDPDDTAGLPSRADCEALLERNIRRLFNRQTVLAASDRYAVLVVLQAMDAGGKDGAIRHVMTGLNPQACHVTSFKVPSDEERRHDFLWRIHRESPRRGEIGIFNRSHYEDVLVVRVHNLAPKSVWSRRYQQINDFERILARNNVVIVKFYLHISREEQARRLAERVENPRKNWKISVSDIAERKHWDDYMAAYDDALSRCSTEYAPWYVIPANKKWFRNVAVSQILADTLGKLKLKYPPPPADISELHAALQETL